MACLKKLSEDITLDCSNLTDVGGIGVVDEAIFINSSDISTISESAGVGVITMVTGKKGFVVSSVNSSVMYQDAIKVNDTVPPAEDQSVIVKVMRSPGSTMGYRALITQLIGGSYRVALKSTNGSFFLAGAFCGLESSDLVTDSSAGGISTVTLKTPEAATGDRLIPITRETYEGLKIPKV